MATKFKEPEETMDIKQNDSVRSVANGTNRWPDWPEWISVEVLQPGQHKLVLVAVKSYTRGDPIKLGLLREDGWMSLSQANCDWVPPEDRICVTHWMDLPSSPHGEQ